MNNFIENKKCEICGKIVKGKRKYCSRQCYYESRKLLINKKGKNIICEICGKEFYAKPYLAKTRRFCSSKCWTQSDESKEIVSNTMLLSWELSPRVGNKNSNWRGGSTSELKCRLGRKKWKQIRKFIMERDNYTCQKCLNNKTNIHIHHIKPYRFGGKDEPDNLISLCPSCHMKEEYIALIKIYSEAIEKYCLQCTCGNKTDIARCEIKNCPLWTVRPYQNNN